jgi:hypothetical protein
MMGYDKIKAASAIRTLGVLMGLLATSFGGPRAQTQAPAVSPPVSVQVASLAASISTRWICLFFCLEIGIRITLSAELFSSPHKPQ